MRKQTVAVTGASGQLGRAILAELTSHDDVEPVAVARAPRKVSDLGLDARAGSYDDAGELEAAFRDVDAVVMVAANSTPDVRLGQHERVIDAARVAGVRRFVYAGILIDETGSGFAPIQKVSRGTEEYLRDSGMEWSVGRAGIYLEPDLEALDQYVAAGRIANCAGTGRCAYTSRPELGAAYARLATSPGLDGGIYQLSGEPVTQSELAQALNEAYGTALVYEPLPVEAYRAERVAALGEFLGGVIAGIYESIAAGGMDVPSDYESVTGRAHETLRRMIEAYRRRQGRA